MNDSLASTLVLCDLDNLLLGEDGNLTQVVRDVLQLFSSRGGRLTVFSQRSPRAVRSILGSVRLAAPALVCGGTMAYHYADGNRVPLCSFAQQQELFACLPDTPGVGVAVQMQDGTTRVLRMSNALERHLRREWTPYLLANAADIHPEQVLRVLLYQDSKSVPLISLAEKAIGDRVALLGERIAPDTLVLTPKRISGREMLDTVCTMAQVGAEQVLALAGGQPMLELVQAVEHSAVAADAPAELRLAAGQVTLTDAAGGAAVEVLYRMVRALCKVLCNFSAEGFLFSKKSGRMGEEAYAKQKTPRGAVPAAVSCRRRGLCCAGVPVCSAAASANAADTAGHKGAGSVYAGGTEHSRCRRFVHPARCRPPQCTGHSGLPGAVRPVCTGGGCGTGAGHYPSNGGFMGRASVCPLGCI